jgi:carbonic anhydrase
VIRSARARRPRVSRRRRKARWLPGLGLVLGLALAGCVSGPEAPGAGGPAHSTSPSAEAGGPRDDWSYRGATGPGSWARIRPEYVLCGSGDEQSPIDLTRATAISGPPLTHLAGRGLLTHEQRLHVRELVDNGHTIQVIDDAPTAIDLAGEHFELVQYHFHAPSEHTIEGRHAPLEAHLVHRSAAGRLVVLAVLIEEGAHSALLEPLVAALPSGPGDSRRIAGVTVDIHDLPLARGPYYRYPGSLTTPPCLQGVDWIVIARPATMSARQIAAFEARLEDNHRPVQPRGSRPVVLVTPP